MNSRSKAFFGLLFCSSMLASMARAQQQSLSSATPIRIPVDAHGVDVTTGDFTAAETLLTAGPTGAGGITVSRQFFGTGWAASYSGTISGPSSGGTGTFTVSIGGGASDSFAGGYTNGGFSYSQGDARNTSLAYDDPTHNFTYTLGDGTAYLFTPLDTSYNNGPLFGSRGRLAKVRHPDGQIDTYTYQNLTFCTGTGGPNPQAKSGTSATSASQTSVSPSPSVQQCDKISRLASIQNNLGYQITIDYIDQGTIYSADHFAVADLSDGLGHTLTYTTSQNLVNTNTYDGLINRSYAYDISGHLTSITTGTASPVTTTLTYDANKRVSTWSDGVATYTYTYSDNTSTNERITTVAGPSGSKTYITNLQYAWIDSYADELNHPTIYTHDLGTYRLTNVTSPEGDQQVIAYDSRNNVTSLTRKSKDGSQSLTTTASYDSTCTTAVKCNKPNSTTDAKGLETDYVYDPTHGGITSVTLPAPSSGAVRPQTRYGYVALNAGGTALYRLQTTSTCATQASCSGTSDETRTTVAYGSNFLPTTVTTAAGDGSLSAASSFTWDASGNLLTATGPLGAGYATRYLYGAANQLLGVIRPQPAAGGALHYRAARYTYNDAGETVMTEQGITSGQQDADFNNFGSIAAVQSLFDIRGLKTSDQLVVGGAVQRLTQYGYNTRALPQCTAVRVPASPSSLPNACSTTSNSAQERITQLTYDAVGNRTGVIEGQGSADAVYTFQATFGADNEQLTTQDANGNVTNFAYDPFLRLTAVTFPTIATDGSNTRLSETYAYDANSNRTQLTRRGGAVLTYGYDNLNRLVSVMQPSTAGYANYTYVYDNLHLRQANSTQGVNYAYLYDALGRETIEGGPNGNMVSAYDSAGRRTRLTWPDGFFATYEYDQTGAMTAVREGGVTSGPGVLAVYGYDEQGRRVSVARGNGSSTGYAYNAAQLLQTLTQTLPSGQGNTDSFSYNYENQLVGKTQSNDGWAWTGAYNFDRAYVANALNQQTKSGTSTLTWAAKGVLSSDGGAQSQGGTVSTYYFDIVNQLFSTSGGSTQQYDAAGRIASVGSSGATRFLYDGTLAVAEYNASGGLTQRYVPGPGADEPVAWYGASGRSTLMSDRLGSVTGVVNDSGALAGLNSYDEYGIPGGGNVGRYQFTGQKWLPEVGLYDYKARNYSTNLGRFVQPDPTGYADGLNFYGYAQTDPVNGTDPLGLEDDVANPNGCARNPARCVPPPPTVIVTGQRPAPPDVRNISAGPSTPNFGGPSSNQNGSLRDGNTPTPQNNNSPDPCAEAKKRLNSVGGQLKSFGNALTYAGLGLDIIGILGDESGVGEALQGGATSAALGGAAASSAGSGFVSYAKTGSAGRATAVAAFSAVADFSAGRATYGLGRVFLAKLAPDTVKLLSELTAAGTEALGEAGEACR